METESAARFVEAANFHLRRSVFRVYRAYDRAEFSASNTSITL
jgi:hypothetical protein